MAHAYDLVLPDDLRKRAVDHLREKLPEDAKRQVRALIKKDPAGWMVGLHFGWGMSVRNLLRGAVRDDELPPSTNETNRGDRNWDDYYVRVVEEAVAE